MNAPNENDVSITRKKSTATPTVTVHPKKVAATLAFIMFMLLFLHLASVWLVHYDPASKVFKHFHKYFDLNREKNVPAFFSSGILMLASSLLFFIYKISDKATGNKGNWLFLALIFLFLAIDEAIEIHEYINHLLHLFIENDFSGFLKWIWVVPYVLLFVIVAVYNLKFLKRLAAATRNNFILSGIIYVLAAAGIESLEGHLTRLVTNKQNLLLLTTTFQEVLEMAAIIFFIYGLLMYIAASFCYVQIAMQKDE